ncbi:MAG: branched-chain amino acid ABC transporter permease [Solirubrobacterales bacterium]
MELLIQVLVQGVLFGGTLGLIALGASIVYSVSGVVNFAHGDFMVLAMYLTLTLYTLFGFEPYLSLLIVGPLMYFLGQAVFRWLLRPLADRHVLLVAQLTLGIVFAMQGILLLAYGGEVQRVPSALATVNFDIGGVVVRAAPLVAFVISLIFAVGFWVMLQYTDYGRSVRAVHQNPAAAARMGVRIKTVQYRTFGLGLAMVAVAGVALAPTVPFEPTSGLQYTLTTFIIMILGGMGNHLGTLMAGLLIGIATAVGEVYISGPVGQMLPLLLFVAVLLLRPKGLFRTAS